MLIKPSSRTVDLELSKQKDEFGADSNILIIGTLSKPFSLCVCICMFIIQNGFVNQLPRDLNPKVSLDITITTTMFREFQGNEKHFLRLALGQMLAHIISLMQDDTIFIVICVCVCVCVCVCEVTQSCPTLCDPVDCSPPGSSVHGILQARILEWVAISFSKGSSQPRDRTQVFCIAGRRFIL